MNIGSKSIQRLVDSSAQEVVLQLPSLPPLIRYHDKFDNKLRTIRNPVAANRFAIHVDGKIFYIRFDQMSEQFGMLLKHVFLHLLGEGLAPSSALKYTVGGRQFSTTDVDSLLGMVPTGIGSFWAKFLARDLPGDAYACAKSILQLFCKYRINDWSDSYHDVISALPLPFKDKYAVVRSGAAFLSVHDEAVIIRFIDETTIKIGELSLQALQDAAMLVCAYQFGMRPLQIAMLSFRDMRIRHDVVDNTAVIHLAFHMVKQRSSTSAKPLLRRVKREWVPIFFEIDRRSQNGNHDLGARVFGVASANEASHRIRALLRNFLKLESTATNLRHTAAQRLVDAGSSQEELAEFLGHSDISTGLVYYETSANQAERVNKALGISEIYSRVARIAHDRFISSDELSQLKESKQIGGAPHGVAIAGIGGCTADQLRALTTPLCPAMAVRNLCL